jgi:hypothetical protein
MKVKELVEMVGEDAEIVFEDGVTEYTYGVEVLNTASDHVTLTYDTSKQYFTTYTGKKLKEAL